MRRPEVRRAAVITHGHADLVREPLERLRSLARERGVELLLPEEEVAKHGDGAAGDLTSADLAVVLGGDGTMLRALNTFLGTEVPVFGVNFGRVGFLASVEAEALEAGVGRAFAGEFEVVELPALEASTGDGRWQAVNDVVVTSSTLGRMIELGWAIGGEDLGQLPCDGLICSTPSGSTAYNLSNGGPVLVWGLDAMALTFVAPHSLHARPLVVPRGRGLTVTNRTDDVGATVLADGQPVHELSPGDRVEARLSEQRSLLATLPESTFFSRYRRTFVAT
ncbi:MAG TPA: NAD(+)/NADH kinase [Gaiellaceae bacterium]|nr:NAD(+)/NADH kinase [Gaiellaceae bacterium]